MNSTSVTVQWGRVDCMHENGEITHYSVRYREVGISRDNRGGSELNEEEYQLTETVSGDSSGGITTISGLTKERLYTVEVAAHNTAGTGAYSKPKHFQTPDGMLAFTLTFA